MAEHIIRHRVGAKWHLVKWNDETGEVYGNTAYAWELMEAVNSAPYTIRTPASGSYVVMAPGTDPADFLALFTHLVAPVGGGLVELPPALQGIEPTGIEEGDRGQGIPHDR